MASLYYFQTDGWNISEQEWLGGLWKSRMACPEERLVCRPEPPVEVGATKKEPLRVNCGQRQRLL